MFPREYPEFGIHGRGGKLYSWYGMGQSLLMFPADVVGTGLAKLPIFVNYNDTDPTARAIFVSYTTNILVNVLTALVCFRFLCQLGFSVKQSVAGVLASAVLYHAPSLHAEHDGEQLHHAADVDRSLLPIRVASNRQRTRTAHRLAGLRAQPADPTYHRPGPDRRRIVSASGSLVGECTRSRAVAAGSDIPQDRIARLCNLRSDRSAVSSLPFRLAVHHIRHHRRTRREAAESIVPAKLSLGSSIPRRLSRAINQAGEIHLSV